MKLYKVLFAGLFFVFLGCGTTNIIEGATTANPAITTKNIVKAHKNAAQEFTTLAARMQVKYLDSKQSQSITTSLRIEKDKTIWIKASILGITLAKVLITPTKVSFYESIDRSYFEGDFALLSNLLGTQINFEQAQAILLGQSILDLQQQKMNSSVVNNKYKLEPKNQETTYFLSILLNPDSFLVFQEQISQPQENRNLIVQYGPYQKVENANYPTQIHMEALENTDKTTIDIKYRKIDLNVSVSFPFTIPQGYTQRSLD